MPTDALPAWRLESSQELGRLLNLDALERPHPQQMIIAGDDDIRPCFRCALEHPVVVTVGGYRVEPLRRVHMLGDGSEGRLDLLQLVWRVVELVAQNAQRLLQDSV